MRPRTLVKSSVWTSSERWRHVRIMTCGLLICTPTRIATRPVSKHGREVDQNAKQQVLHQHKLLRFIWLRFSIKIQRLLQWTESVSKCRTTNGISNYSNTVRLS